MKNYYEILEVNPKASKEVIEKAYRVLVKKYHPDLYEGQYQVYAEKRIKDINEAYRILSDDFFREQYDREMQEEEIKGHDVAYEESKKRIQEREEMKKKIIEEEKEIEKNTYKVGTLSGILEVGKNVFRRRSNVKRTKEMTKKDMQAIGITIGIVIGLGIILWFVPFTNQFMRELILENEFVRTIGRLFGMK